MNLLRNLNIDFVGDISSVKGKHILLCIILIGAVLRVYGIWHGYPHSYYPDEAHFVKRALSFGSGDFNPHWFHKPAFYMYILFFEYGLLFIFGKIVGIWNSVTDFAVYYIKSPGIFYLMGRLTTVIFSLGVIALTYLAAEKIFSRKAAIISGLIVALSYGHIIVAKDIKADTPCAFFTIASCYYLMRYLSSSRKNDILISSVLAGLGAATKYYSIVMLVPIFLAPIVLHKTVTNLEFKKWAQIVSLCIVAFYFSYFLGSPYNFIDPLGRKFTFGSIFKFTTSVQKVIESPEPVEKSKIEDEMRIKKKKHSIFYKRYSIGIFSYAKILSKGMGSFVVSLSIFGFIYLLFKKIDRKILCFFTFPIIFISIAILIRPGNSDIRHQIVIYPFIAISASFGLLQILQRDNFNRIINWILISLLFLPLLDIIPYNIMISRKDTRTLAKEWIEAQIPSGTKMIVDENGPHLQVEAEMIETQLEKVKMEVQKGQFTTHHEKYLSYQLKAAQKSSPTYQIYEIRHPWWRSREVQSGTHRLTGEYDKDMGNPLKPVGVNNFDYYKKNDFKYAIVQSSRYNTFLKDTPAAHNFPSFTKFYRDLFTKGYLINEFSSKDGNRPGPIVKIFKISE